MDEAEDRIEPLAVLWRRLPGDDLAAQSVDHLAAFRYEIVDQIVHRARRSCMHGPLWRGFGKQAVYFRAAEARISSGGNGRPDQKHALLLVGDLDLAAAVRD